MLTVGLSFSSFVIRRDRYAMDVVSLEAELNSLQLQLESSQREIDLLNSSLDDASVRHQQALGIRGLFIRITVVVLME